MSTAVATHEINIDDLKRERTINALKLARAARYPDKHTADEVDDMRRAYIVAKVKLDIAEAVGGVSLTVEDRRQVRNYIRDLP